MRMFRASALNHSHSYTHRPHFAQIVVCIECLSENNFPTNDFVCKMRKIAFLHTNFFAKLLPKRGLGEIRKTTTPPKFDHPFDASQPAHKGRRTLDREIACIAHALRIVRTTSRWWGVHWVVAGGRVRPVHGVVATPAPAQVSAAWGSHAYPASDV